MYETRGLSWSCATRHHTIDVIDANPRCAFNIIIIVGFCGVGAIIPLMPLALAQSSAINSLMPAKGHLAHGVP